MAPARRAAVFGVLAALLLAVGLSVTAGTEAAKPRVQRLVAQQLTKNPRLGVAVVGRARGSRVVVRYRSRGCKRVKLRRAGRRARGFAVAVYKRRGRCRGRGVRPGWVRVNACVGKSCAQRQIRLRRFRDRDGDGLGDLFERRVLRTKPRRADTDRDGLGDGEEVLVLQSDPLDPNSPRVPIAQPACADGAQEVTSGAALRSAVAAGRDACVVAPVGDVDLDDLGPSPVHVGSKGSGSLGSVDLKGTELLTLRARFRSTELDGSHGVTIENSIIGGSPSHRVSDQLIFAPGRSDDLRIERNEIGWTTADDSGNTGYGCRCYGTLNRLRFVGNRVHDIAADGFQGVGGSDVLIDRNEIGPVGANPDSSEHSDNIQITGNGPNLRITNNWIHHQGYYEGSPEDNAGSTYIHGGGSGSLLYENNLVETNLGRTEICGLGTGGTSRSNITIRRNTWVDGGRAFTGFPGFEWDCDSGSGNLIERNIAVDPDGGFALGGSAAAASFSSNLWGKPPLVSLDADGNCVSANCNPLREEPIGYRKPDEVSW